MEEEPDESTTYYTNDRTQVTKKRAKKKRPVDDGCNAWEQLDYLKNLVQGWTRCGSTGDVHHEEEDDDDEDYEGEGDGDLLDIGGMGISDAGGAGGMVSMTP